MKNRGIISIVLKRVMDHPGNENKFMLLCKHHLISIKDFFLNIDNTIERKILRGVYKLTNQYFQTFYYGTYFGTNTVHRSFGKMPVNFIRGAI